MNPEINGQLLNNHTQATSYANPYPNLSQLHKWQLQFLDKKLLVHRHHISPYWYDIVYFGPKPSWIYSWALPQRSYTNGDIYSCLYTHDPPHF